MSNLRQDELKSRLSDADPETIDEWIAELERLVDVAREKRDDCDTIVEKKRLSGRREGFKRCRKILSHHRSFYELYLVCERQVQSNQAIINLYEADAGKPDVAFNIGVIMSSTDVKDEIKKRLL